MDLVFFKIALVLYLGATLGYLVFIIFTSSLKTPAAFWAVAAGFVAHSLSILHRAIFSGFFPLATAFDALSFFAWLIILFFLVLRLRVAGPIFGAITVPIALVLTLYGLTLSHQVGEPLVPVLKSWWLPIHVVFALLGNGVFAVMAVGGLMYIIQERLIKRKKIGRFYKLLPSLETLDTINRHGLPLGFFFMTLGIVSGVLWAGRAWGYYWTWDPKETWTLITWFAYAAMIHQRIVLGWRGRRAALLAIAGFCLVMFTFLGVSAFLGGHHGFENQPRFMRPPST